MTEVFILIVVLVAYVASLKYADKKIDERNQKYQNNTLDLIVNFLFPENCDQ